MLSRAFLLVVVVACQPIAVSPPPPPAPSTAVQRLDACRDDIADCVAACALRESQRLEYLDYYDRRCAAAVLGKDPEAVARRAHDPSQCREARTLDALCSVKDAKEALPTNTRK
jgi:hypothetical protein